MQFHVFDENATPWGDSRWSFYGGQYTPTAAFNGTDVLVGALSDVDQQYTVYRANHFLPERAVPTDVTIELGGEDLGGGAYRISAQVGIEAAGAGKTMRVYMVQVLDHWPETRPYHRNGFKQAAPTQDITLAPGQSQVVQNDFTFDAGSWAHPENIKIVVWAQAPLENAPAQVYQAAIRLWPLISYPGDQDGDGVADAEDNCPERYNPDQADADNDGVGDLCDDCETEDNPAQTDADEDGFGDLCDNCPALHSINQDDTDGDGVGDVCDSCPEVDAPAGVDAFGRSLGTMDLDCDVDANDLALFGACMAGSGVTTPPPGCDPADFARADVDDDGDVDLADFAVINRNVTGPLVSPATYVGAQYCADCHAENHALWSQTIHATAFDTLINSGDGDNVLCFPCHTVGYGQPSGFVDLDTTPELADVQCENCHGPGSNHVADPNGVPLVTNMDADLCGSCHQSCHGLCGDEHHPQYEQWSTSTHATALLDIQWLPEAEDSCLQCHSTDYRLAPEGEKPTLFEAVYDIECVACHVPHGSENVGQLRLPPSQLCADCHTMDGAVPPDDPNQPQAETLHGEGGFELDGSPLEGPYSQHWWGVPDECVTCHVHTEPYTDPEHPADSGHTFLASMRACEPCHSEEAATLLVQTTQEEISTRLALIAHYYDPGDPLYVDPAELTPEEQAQYVIAEFDYQMVLADRSLGTHDAGYTRALLGVTEDFFGIPPWRWMMLLDGGGGPAYVPSVGVDDQEVRP